MARKNWIDPQVRKLIYDSIDRVGFLKFLGSQAVKRFGNGETRGTCPIHKGDDETAFRLYPDTNWVCETHKCHDSVKQDIFSLVQKSQRVNFSTAVSVVSSYCGVQVDIEEIDETKKDAINNFSWANSINPERYEKELNIEISPSLIYRYMTQRTDYMYERGFTEETLNDFEIGHSFDWITIKDLAKYDLPPEDRVSIPIKFEGKYVSIQGRCTKGKGTKRKCPSDPWPRDKKYDNLKDFSKSLVMYNYDRAIQYAMITNRLLLTEGAPNAMMWHQIGVPNVTATLGSEVSDDHIKLLAQGIWKVCLAFDPDKAGKAGCEKFIEKGKHLFDIETLPYMPTERDAAECSPKELYYAYTHPKRLLLV